MIFDAQAYYCNVLTGTLLKCVSYKLLILPWVCFPLTIQVVCLDSPVSLLHKQDDEKCKFWSIKAECMVWITAYRVSDMCISEALWITLV